MYLKQIKKNDGFTLVELLVASAMFLIILAAASNVFINILNQFKQQSKIAETNIEGAVSLEMLRRDLESAGYGVPWNVTGGVTSWASLAGYFEAADSATLLIPNPAGFNNGTSAGTGGSAPRAIFTGNNVTTFSGGNAIFNGSDYLVIRSLIVPRTNVVQKWTRLQKDMSTGLEIKRDNLSGYTFAGNDGVIVLSAGATETTGRALVVFGTAYSTSYNATANFAPADMSEIRIIYGVRNPWASVTDIRMPFNRADYFIRRVNSAGVSITPTGCAPNTGVLTKAVIEHTNGGMTDYPILDCVADMQVVYVWDMDDNGNACTESNAASTALTSQSRTRISSECSSEGTVDVPATLNDASLLRKRLKEVQVYILAHEGQKDISYTYPSTTITVGPTSDLGRNYDVSAYRNYRWKIYTLVVRLNNLWGK